MKQLGNLALVCAKRRDTLMQVLDGSVTIHVGHEPDKSSFTMDWHDDARIFELILELNHGRFREERALKGEKAA